MSAESLIEATVAGHRAWLNVVDNRVEWVTVECDASVPPSAFAVDEAIHAHGLVSAVDAATPHASGEDVVCYAPLGWQP